MSGNPIISVGTHITCENGHLIAAAKKDVCEFSDHRKESYDFVTDSQQMNGARCATCGALYQLVMGPIWETGIVPCDDDGNQTAPPLTARRITGAKVHTPAGWVVLGQTAEEWLAQHPEAEAEMNKQFTNINAETK